MQALIDKVLATLEGVGWHVERAAERRALPQLIRDRYPAIPDAAVAFIERIDACVRPDETIWFLACVDFAGRSDSAYAWNEWEKLGLEGADNKVARETRRFWDNHFPILFSVGGDYAYLAINVDQSSPGLGCIVRGDALDFDSVTEVAKSFPDLLRDVIQLAQGDVWERANDRAAWPAFLASDRAAHQRQAATSLARHGGILWTARTPAPATHGVEVAGNGIIVSCPSPATVARATFLTGVCCTRREGWRPATPPLRARVNN